MVRKHFRNIQNHHMEEILTKFLFSMSASPHPFFCKLLSAVLTSVEQISGSEQCMVSIKTMISHSATMFRCFNANTNMLTNQSTVSRHVTSNWPIRIRASGKYLSWAGLGLIRTISNMDTIHTNILQSIQLFY